MRAKLSLGGSNPFSGLTVVNMSPALAEELDFDPFVTGVVVRALSRNSLSARYRFRPGDIILSVMDTEITSTTQFQDVLDEFDENRNWDLTFERGGRVHKSRIRF
ncbi:MAG: PDZ domain-containing protein [Robiginitomaculum sp.]|nr:PDZ domain-containing protein [Robiginitomaculum sp.]